MRESPRRVAVFAMVLLVASGGAVVADEEVCRNFALLLELDDPLDEVDDGFGHAVAIDGTVAVVGVPRDRLLGHATGRAVVYELGPTGWERTASLRSDVPQSLSDFGNAVAVQGDLIAVGSQQDDEAITDGGAVHLFRRMPDGSWPHVQRLHPSDPQWAAQFGWSVALDDGRLAAGCVRCATDAAPLIASGSVYVFEDDGTGRFVERAMVAAEDPQVSARFGYSVAIDDDLLVVGEPLRDEGADDHVGRAHVFSRAADGTWALESELLPPGRQATEESGLDVAIEEDLVAVATGPLDGALRLWRRSAPGDWSLEAQLRSDDPRSWFLAESVALADGRVATTAERRREGLLAIVYESLVPGEWGIVDEMGFESEAQATGRPLAFDGRHALVGSPVWSGGGRAWMFGCKPPPDCDAGPLVIESDCDGVRLDGFAEDPHERELTTLWSSDCPDLVFDPSPSELDPLVLLDTTCERDCELTLLVTADDGSSCSDSLSLRIDDAAAPVLVVPEPLTLECTGAGGMAASDPLIAAWLASVSATDSCNEIVIEHDAPAFFPSGCLPGASTTVSFLARDACGNESRAETELILVDSTPPVVEPGDEVVQELWAPNHRWVEVAAESLSPRISDACDPVPADWRIAGCTSDEALDGRGDGRTEPDCLVSEDGLSVSVRAERSGRGEGRSYELAIIAGDTCGNWSSPVPIGSVRVRHDRRR